MNVDGRLGDGLARLGVPGAIASWQSGFTKPLFLVF